jgi:hypothetical protein
MRKAKTHFEQVPLEIVRKIAEPQRDEPAAGPNGQGIVENAVTEPGAADHNSEQGLRYPKWQKVCQEALVELDLDKLKERVFFAEAAVFVRMQELPKSSDGEEERLALIDVISSLRYLKRDALKYPDWESPCQVQPVSRNT